MPGHLRHSLAALLPGMALVSCLGSGSSSDSVKRGLLVNSCGPADAPIVLIFFSDSAMTCGPVNTKDPAVAYQVGELNVSDISRISLHPDSVYTSEYLDTRCPEKCMRPGPLDVRFTDSAGGVFSGKYHLGKGAGSEEGRFDVKTCRERPLCG